MQLFLWVLKSLIFSDGFWSVKCFRWVLPTVPSAVWNFFSTSSALFETGTKRCARDINVLQRVLGVRYPYLRKTPRSVVVSAAKRVSFGKMASVLQRGFSVWDRWCDHSFQWSWVATSNILSGLLCCAWFHWVSLWFLSVITFTAWASP